MGIFCRLSPSLALGRIPTVSVCCLASQSKNRIICD
nr:MAG TPA: hypothetical protein [Caudoviricetes sp.]DAZ59286.1 MAG TPA: hypothetical protein [Caudoviricetes sp.]